MLWRLALTPDSIHIDVLAAYGEAMFWAQCLERHLALLVLIEAPSSEQRLGALIRDAPADKASSVIDEVTSSSLGRLVKWLYDQRVLVEKYPFIPELVRLRNFLAHDYLVDVYELAAEDNQHRWDLIRELDFYGELFRSFSGTVSILCQVRGLDLMHKEGPADFIKPPDLPEHDRQLLALKDRLRSIEQSWQSKGSPLDTFSLPPRRPWLRF